jgi:hypothetical protein
MCGALEQILHFPPFIVYSFIHSFIHLGIKVQSIVSYNHLGNNDGKNLSQPDMFRSKEISKSNVVDDMVAANRILYEEVLHTHKQTNTHTHTHTHTHHTPHTPHTTHTTHTLSLSLTIWSLPTVCFTKRCF